MKTFLIFTLLFVSNFASASFSQNRCYQTAKSALGIELAGENYDNDDYYDGGCSLADNKKAVLCLLGASKGDGAATDTYLVVLNKICTHVFRIQLVGEE